MLHLVIYQLNGVTICFMVTPESATDLRFYRRLDEFAGAHVRVLAQQISTQVARRPNTESAYRYIYFNHINLALKASVNSQLYKVRQCSAPAPTKAVSCCVPRPRFRIFVDACLFYLGETRL